MRLALPFSFLFSDVDFWCFLISFLVGWLGTYVMYIIWNHCVYHTLISYLGIFRFSECEQHHYNITFPEDTYAMHRCFYDNRDCETEMNKMRGKKNRAKRKIDIHISSHVKLFPHLHPKLLLISCYVKCYNLIRRIYLGMKPDGRRKRIQRRWKMTNK